MALPCYDGNGNVTEILDPNGICQATYEYTPFGQLFTASGPAAHSNPWRFSTKPYDDLWGLIFYEYRAYSPDLQVWLSRDPIEADAIRAGFDLSNCNSNCTARCTKCLASGCNLAF